MKEKHKKLLLILAVIGLIATLGFFGFKYYQDKQIKEIEYVKFVDMLKNGQVKTVRIDLNNPQFEFDDEKKVTYKSENPKTEEFKSELLLNGVKVEEVKPSILAVMLRNIISTAASVGIMVLLLKYLMDQSIANPHIEQSADKVKNTFKDIAGNEEAKEDMEFLVNFLKDPKAYEKMGAKLPKGVILFGAPGTGKTLTARAIAGEAGVPFFNVTGSDFIEMYAGLGAKRVRTLFKDAKEQSPCIVFIDELDALGTSRGGINDTEKDQTINALLAEMDGFDPTEGVIVVAATNRMEDLDEALIRPGRFDRHIGIELPDYKSRLQILKLHSANKKLAEDVSLEALAKMTIGESGAALESILNEAAIIAVNRGGDEIFNADIDEAHFKMLVKGNPKKNHDRSEEKTELVAYHEGGHALLAKLLTDNSVPKVTIVPSTSGVGGATFNVPKENDLFTKKDLESQVIVMYGGRAAEEILLGSKDLVSTGAADDIKRSTEIIKSYFGRYGMSEEFGMIWVEDLEGKELIKQSIKLSEELYERAIGLLRENKAKLDEIAKLLIEKETIIEAELDYIMENF